VGGTFEPLHDGHKALLKKAYEIGDVYIGLTSDAMAKRRYRDVLPYGQRKQILERYIRREFGVQASIFELRDPYGPTISEHFDCIVVSPETYSMAEKINQIRADKGLPSIDVIKIDFVLAQDGKPISATRVKNGEIDEHGVSLQK